MSVLIVFFALGIILLALEIVTPGPLCGIAGCICMVMGVIKAFGMFGSLGGALAVLLALAALALAGCGSQKRYPMVGEIMALDPAAHNATIKHEKIGDWMDVNAEAIHGTRPS